ncbi:MAG: ABC transporter substrate-binding protein [Bacteroidales bacterium]|nr:ABC transporter substrate-binding protein [Bacteroidales bacterium]
MPFFSQTISTKKLKSPLYIPVKQLLVLLSIFFTLYTPAQASPEKVVLRLKWKHQFQFAGYYAALEKGFYEDAGLSVDIKEIEPGVDYVDEVMDGAATYGIGNSELAVRYMEGEPIVVLACIFQHSPAVLMVKEQSKIFTPQDLVGKIIEAETLGAGAEIRAMLQSEGLRDNLFTLVPATFSLNQLLSDKVHAVNIYTTNEPYFFDKFGIPYRIINPKHYGIDFYADCLFTSKKEQKRNPERVKKFREASLKGWEYAIAHPEEISQLIIQKYKSTKTLDHLMFEAEQTKALINADFIEIGHTNKGRWIHQIEILADLGLIKKVRSIDDFIYDPNATRAIVSPKIVGLFVGIIIVLTIVFLLFNRRLSLLVNQRTEELTLLTQRLEQQNREITKINLDLLNAKEKAENSDKLKTIFLANISHEIRTPMNGIMGFAELIKSKQIPEEKKDSFFDLIIRNSKQLLNLINDIIEIAKIESEQIVITYSKLNMSVFFKKISTFIEYELSAQKKSFVRVTISIDRNRLSDDIITDAQHLELIITRLLNYSLRTTEKGMIEIGASKQENDTLVVWIKDTGNPIDDELKGLIANQTKSGFFPKENQRMDLGLNIAQGIAMQMGGQVNISNNIEGGKKFSIEIPYTPYLNT